MMSPDTEPPDFTISDVWLLHVRRVLDICYRMLGTLADAEDATQEAFARLAAHGLGGIADVEAWLVTVGGRICLDRLRSDKSRARYIGPWLPEPLVDFPDRRRDPADQVTLDDSVRIALLSMMERLSPAERVVFVLHDVFGYTFEQIAGTIGRTPAACRKLASRARAALRADDEPRFDIHPDLARGVAERFAAACTDGDLAELVQILDPNIVGEFDSGGRIPGAPLNAQVGAHLVAATLIRALSGSSAQFRIADVNGQPGLVVQLHGHTMAVITIETDGNHIHAIRAIGNPDKLERLNR